jgi:purine-nucleoside phosphorylase
VKGLSSLAVAVLALSTFACTASNVSQSTSNDDPPLTMAQTKWITDVLETSDKIDILFKNNVKEARQYFNVQVKVEEKYFANKDLLPTSDTRAILLVNTVKAYQQVVALITADEMGLPHDSPDDEMVKAVLRKALLRKIKSGKLTPDERKFVDDLRRELQN